MIYFSFKYYSNVPSSSYLKDRHIIITSHLTLVYYNSIGPIVGDYLSIKLI